MQFVVRFILSLIVVWLILMYVPGFTNRAGVEHAFTWVNVVWAVIVLGILNALLGPILRLLAAPITWLTMGAFGVVVNWILFGLTVWITPNVKGGPIPTLIGAVILTIVSVVVQQLWKTRPERNAIA